MKHYILHTEGLVAALGLALTTTLCGAASPDSLSGQAPQRVALSAEPFDLSQVRLLPGPFQHGLELDQKYLLMLSPERMLHNFRVNAGLPSSAEPLGGWERPKCELRGHFTGHYLSACALLHVSTGDKQLKANVNAVVAGLAECQARFTNGYLSAFPEEFFDRLEAHGNVWAPYYTLHKILAGLLDAHRYCGNPQALEVARHLADWVVARNAKFTQRQMDSILATEHGGMNEALADLYALTHEEKYLAMAQRFTESAIIRPAARGEDRITGLHANTTIPKFVGATRLYELTGAKDFRIASEFFWQRVTQERSYVTGGCSDGEYFTPKQQLSQALSVYSTESCPAYNMLKLTRRLFCLEPRAEYADFYERALYNQILGSQNPEDGMVCHYVPLKAGSRKTYSTPTGWCCCCTGVGIENHAKYGDSIYFHGESGLYVNLFMASELVWTNKGLKLRQETSYPEQGKTRLVFTCDKPAELQLNLRHPWWAPTNSVEIAINGQKQPITSVPTSWIEIKRAWKTGDTLDLTMPLTLRTEGFRDNPNRLAFMNGPLVLCAEVGTNNPSTTLIGERAQLASQPRPAKDKPNTFTIPAEMFSRTKSPETPTREMTLEPFYKMHGPRHYAVYWDVTNPPESK